MRDEHESLGHFDRVYEHMSWRSASCDKRDGHGRDDVQPDLVLSHSGSPALLQHLPRRRAARAVEMACRTKLRPNSARKFGGDSRGDALTEFAFASAIFFVTVFGTVLFGIAVWRYNLIADLAQEGARWASVHGSTGSSPQADNTSLTTYVTGRAIGMNL